MQQYTKTFPSNPARNRMNHGLVNNMTFPSNLGNKEKVIWASCKTKFYTTSEEEQ